MKEEFNSDEIRIIYQDVIEKLQREKRLSEQDKEYLKGKKPEFYDMVESLEKEIEVYREKLKNCGSKKEVQDIKESFEDGLLMGISLVESSPVLPLEKKLEYTMFKDTKLSVMDAVIEEFVKSTRYEELPDEAQDMQKTNKEESASRSEEELELQKIKRAKAMSSYAENRRTEDTKEASPFDTKG